MLNILTFLSTNIFATKMTNLVDELETLLNGQVYTISSITYSQHLIFHLLKLFRVGCHNIQSKCLKFKIHSSQTIKIYPIMCYHTEKYVETLFRHLTLSYNRANPKLLRFSISIIDECTTCTYLDR